MNDRLKQPGRFTAVRAVGLLERPILAFELNAEIEGLRGEDAWHGRRNSKTLVKHVDFRVVLTALKAGARLHEHKAAGRISVQTIAGHIRMHVQD